MSQGADAAENARRSTPLVPGVQRLKPVAGRTGALRLAEHPHGLGKGKRGRMKGAGQWLAEDQGHEGTCPVAVNTGPSSRAAARTEGNWVARVGSCLHWEAGRPGDAQGPLDSTPGQPQRWTALTLLSACHEDTKGGVGGERQSEPEFQREQEREAGLCL